ncbi:hypothetical protein GW915_10285 [bacterium]|nr:hypothetical protein [bacterium]
MPKKILKFLSLFGSLSTLFCCALPVLFVSLGMGAVFASVGSTFPQIYWLTGHKDILFLMTGIFLVASYLLSRNAEKLSCPTDSELRDACQTAKPTSKWLFRLSLTIYLLGLAFSYIIPWVLYA